MRFTTAIILIFVISAATTYLFPWWTIAVVAYGISFTVALRPGKSFLAGFLAIGALWLCWILWIDIFNEHILSKKMAALFHLPNYVLFIMVTVLVGGLTGGVSAWAGALMRKAFKPG